jgi:hypothetical protein
MKFLRLLTISIAISLTLTACGSPTKTTTIQSEKAFSQPAISSSPANLQPASQSTTASQLNPKEGNKTENNQSHAQSSTPTNGDKTVNNTSQTTDASKQSTALATSTAVATPPAKETTKAVSETKQEDTIKILSITSPAARNSTATLKAKVTPGSTASIVVHYKSGPSKAAGLESKNADSSGNVSWSWHVGGNTTLGNWRITVSSGNSSAETTFEVVH